ncbi:MAG: hypothetical protein ACOY3O_13775 [Thermodesulfobacteriota bacterium]
MARSGANQGNRWKVCPVSRTVPGKKGHAGDRCMCAYQKIREWGSLRTAGPPIPHKAFSGQEGSFVRYGQTSKGIFRQSCFQVLYLGKTDGYLRIDHRIYAEDSLFCALRDLRGGPGKPVCILGQDIKQDIAVNHDFAESHSSPLVKAMISAVDILTVALPRIRAMSFLPRALSG